ncbi:MAG: hypothetical protein NZ480_03680 [Bdellovibrionaceae bacterium]|nr:hypothetical protein [Pseudobdellovibrionaceae bacterium]MDW8189464.1 hypothetical protein [Pseudobdellovibrionaceae bacterium]
MGCHLPVGENPPQPVTPKPDLGFESKCLAHVLPTMADFINGTATPQQISSAWNCFSSGLTVFSRKVKGEGLEEYSARELAQFFEDFLFENLKLNQTLLTEIMRIKQVLVGGRIDSLTRAEIDGLIRFAHIARDASIEVLPYMKIVSLNWKPNVEQSPNVWVSEFRKANTAFQKFIQTIGAQIQKNNVQYRLANLLTLLKEISQLYGQEWSFLGALQRYMPVVEDMKKVLIGGEGGIIEPSEWLRFATLVSRGYMQYARYHYFLKDLSPKLSSFELLFLADALDDLLSFLSHLTQYKPEGKLTLADITLAISSLKTVFPKLEVSNALVGQIFYLKQLFFGGSHQIALPEEFERGREKIRLFERIAQQFLVHVEIYLFHLAPRYPLTDTVKLRVEKAMEDLVSLSKEIVPLFETDYDLENFKTLIFETDKLLIHMNGIPSQTLTELLRFFPVLQKLKNFATASKTSLINKGEWPLLTRFAALTLNHFIFYYYRLSPVPSWRREVPTAEIFVEKILDHLSELVQIHKGNIRYSFFYDIIDALHLTQYISQRWSASSIKRLFFVIVHKILRPRSLPKDPLSAGFLNDHIQTIRSWMGHFKLSHEGLTKIFVSQNKSEIGRAELTGLLSHAFQGDLSKRLHELLISPSFNTISTNTGRLVFNKSKKLSYDLISVQNKNIFRILAEIIIRAYSHQDNVLHLNKESYDQFISDILPILLDLHLTSPDKPDFGNSRFLEANLFMPSSNGNQILDYAEAVEILQFLWSGILRHNQILTQIDEHCSTAVQLFTEIEYPFQCWLEQSYQSFPHAYKEMPEAVTFYQALSRERFFATWSSFLIASGYVPSKPNFVFTRDLSLVPHIVQYVESLITRFDLNNDEILDRVEALKAFPTFEEMLKTATRFKNRRILKAGYAYLLVYKKLPKTLREKLHFMIIWTGQEDEWPIRVNRGDLAKILEVTAHLLRKNKDQESPSSSQLIEDGIAEP